MYERTFTECVCAFLTTLLQGLEFSGKISRRFIFIPSAFRPVCVYINSENDVYQHGIKYLSRLLKVCALLNNLTNGAILVADVFPSQNPPIYYIWKL